MSDTYLSASVDGGESIMDYLVNAMYQEEGKSFAAGGGDIGGYLETLANATALSGKTVATALSDLGKLIAGVNSRYQRMAGVLMNMTAARQLMAATVSASDGRNVMALRRETGTDPTMPQRYMTATGDPVYEDPFIPDAFADANKRVAHVLSHQGYRIHDFPNQMRVERFRDLAQAKAGSVAFLGTHYVAAGVVDTSGNQTWKTTS